MPVVDELVTLIDYKLDERGVATLNAAKKGVVEMASKVAALAAAIVVGRTAFQGWINGIVDQSMKLQTLSDDTGISAAAFERWGYMVQHLGGDAKTSMASIEALQLSLKSVVPGVIPNPMLVKQIPEVMRQGGIEIDEVMMKLHRLYADLAKTPGGVQQAFRFGASIGLDKGTVRALMQSDEIVNKMMKDWHALNGDATNDKSIKANAELWKSFDNLKTGIHGYEMQLATLVAPTIQRLLDKTNELITANQNLDKSFVKPAQKAGRSFSEMITSDGSGKSTGNWAVFEEHINAIGNSVQDLYNFAVHKTTHIVALAKDIGDRIATVIKGVVRFAASLGGTLITDAIGMIGGFVQVFSTLGKNILWVLDLLARYEKTGFKPETPQVNNPYAPTLGSSSQSSIPVDLRIDMHVNGQKHSITTKAVPGALNAYFFDPLTVN